MNEARQDKGLQVISRSHRYYTLVLDIYRDNTYSYMYIDGVSKTGTPSRRSDSPYQLFDLIILCLR